MTDKKTPMAKSKALAIVGVMAGLNDPEYLKEALPAGVAVLGALSDMSAKEANETIDSFIAEAEPALKVAAEAIEIVKSMKVEVD